MNDNEIIQEATEAVTKGYPCAFYVPQLLEVIKSKDAEIENFNHIKETVDNFWSELQKLSMFKGKDTPTLEELLDYIEQAKSEAYREFAERLCKDRVSNDPVVIAVKVELEELTEKNDKE